MCRVGVPKLRGIVLGPVLRPDGSVLVDPGYDAETGILNLDEEEFDNDSTEYT